jgi:hypothetical protein
MSKHCDNFEARFKISMKSLLSKEGHVVNIVSCLLSSPELSHLLDLVKQCQYNSQKAVLKCYWNSDGLVAFCLLYII